MYVYSMPSLVIGKGDSVQTGLLVSMSHAIMQTCRMYPMKWDIICHVMSEALEIRNAHASNSRIILQGFWLKGFMLNVSISALHCRQYNHLNTLLQALLNEIILTNGSKHQS